MLSSPALIALDDDQKSSQALRLAITRPLQ
jgi:hypothetical protein